MATPETEEPRAPRGFFTFVENQNLQLSDQKKIDAPGIK